MLCFTSPDCFILFYIDFFFVLKEFMRTNMDLSGSKNYKFKLLSKFMSENETIINNKSSHNTI